MKIGVFHGQQKDEKKDQEMVAVSAETNNRSANLNESQSPEKTNENERMSKAEIGLSFIGALYTIFTFCLWKFNFVTIMFWLVSKYYGILCFFCFRY